MDIFEKPSRKLLRSLRILIPALLLLLLCGIFLGAVSEASGETLEKEKLSLERALKRGAVHTYALEGRYPESLSVLLEKYHITYDKEKFVVEYVPNGANLLPMISVLPLNRGKGGLP